MVEIPESYLLTFLGVIFVPLFIFLMKMIMEQGNTRTKVENIIRHIEETKDLVKQVYEHTTEIKLIRQRLDQIEAEVKDLCRLDRKNINTRERERVRFRDDDSDGYTPEGDMKNHG